ncbi:nucleotide exchange factor GrpE [Shewanella colwelliana]|uniref:Protein GrpE n=1 Tax=Shewanella colwelliana TaxID=23 RepID=A0A1E5IUB4_SHECO|nr:nucleotide exchange factor GrpE [Shewanella colwelliana]MCZ4337549.1 nucleotide exchange factor GrpE [Shewanella colwelliana]MDX1281971.1 nucleotide exchange factor GrpE [Shewanella colwelliana]OEG73543.1 nucleotide exchange factor GrpE [Shewanella colwelliana]GIU25747.1 protein GrpE [Shewanella colwelliana]GIU40404.1 protein GrpE [Shewanella colwelliana]
MSNESSKAQEPQIDETLEAQVDTEVVEDEASLMDELTQANFRVEELEQALAAAEAKVEEQKDSVIRAAAEVDNVRRRAAMDVEKAHKFALEKFANELLPVIDNLERALSGTNSEDENTKAIFEGVELTLKSFTSAVEKFGLSQINPQGEAFDPEHHQAIGMQPSADFPANTVMMVMQKGYLLNDRLLRPAMVMVSQGGASVDTQA